MDVLDEKRKTPRLTIRDDVTLVVPGKTDSSRCVLENISRGGAKFVSTFPLQVGSRVQLRVPSPENEPEIVIQAKIVRPGVVNNTNSFSYACVIEHTENA